MAAVKQKLPNLKICIDNEGSGSDDDLSLTEEPEVSVEDGQSEREVIRKPDQEEPDSPMSNHGTDDVQFNVYLDKLKKLPDPTSQLKVQPSRVYENKAGDFITGIDYTHKEARQKREERAKRFGIPVEPTPEVDFDGLYESLGLKLEDLERRDERGIRLEAIHFRGVSEMNTKDVFSYFQEFAAGGIEWIDDDSCNVVWLDKVTAARAMLKLSKSYDQVMRERGLLPDVIPRKKKPPSPERMEVDTEPKKSDDSTEPSKEERTEEKMEEDDDALDLTEDKQDSAVTENKQEEKKKEELEKEDGELSEEGEIKDSDEESDHDSRDLRKNIRGRGEVPWPPGKWRMGVPCPGKTEYLFLRFATKADVKLPGAERRSRFYQKYGNPNYGGMTGLISNSRKRKLRSYQPREELANISEQGSASVADRNQVSYAGFDIFSDTLGPVEEEGMGLYPKLKKDKIKKKQDDEEFSDRESEEEMESDYENRFPVVEKVVPRRKLGTSDGNSNESEDSGVDERELEQLLGQATKRPAMKMYADELEEQQTARRTRQAIGALTIVADAKKKLKRVKDARQLIAGVDLRTALQEKSQSKLNSIHYSRDRDSVSRSPSPVDMRDRLQKVPSPIHRTIENSPPRAVKRYSPIRIESTLEKSPSPIQRTPSPEDVRAVKSKETEEVRSRSPSISSPSPSPSPPPKPVDARMKIKDARAKINEARAKKMRRSASPRGVMRSDLPQKRIRSPVGMRRRSRSPFGVRRRSPFRPRRDLRRSRSNSPANWLDRLDTGIRPRFRRPRSRSPIRNRPRWQRQRSRSRSRSPINRRRSPVRRQPIQERTRSGRDARHRFSRKSRSPSSTESDSEEENIAPSRIKMTVEASSSSSSSSEDSSSSSSDSSSSDSSSSSSSSDSDSDSDTSSDSDNSASPAPRRRLNKDRGMKHSEKSRISPRRRPTETARKRTQENLRKRPQDGSRRRAQEKSKHSMRTQVYNDD